MILIYSLKGNFMFYNMYQHQVPFFSLSYGNSTISKAIFAKILHWEIAVFKSLESPRNNQNLSIQKYMQIGYFMNSLDVFFRFEIFWIFLWLLDGLLYPLRRITMLLCGKNFNFARGAVNRPKVIKIFKISKNWKGLL